MVVFGADVWASDWLPQTPEQELHLLLTRIAKVGRGIVLLHDTKAQTAHMLPALLRALKQRRLPHRACRCRPARAGPEAAQRRPKPPLAAKATPRANSEKATENKAVASPNWLILG